MKEVIFRLVALLVYLLARRPCRGVIAIMFIPAMSCMVLAAADMKVFASCVASLLRALMAFQVGGGEIDDDGVTVVT